MFKTFPASLNQLYNMLDFVKRHAASMGFEQSRILKIELAIEEVLVNIISYGYPQSLGDIHIYCFQEDMPHGLKIIIKDQGIPFNPLLHIPEIYPEKIMQSNEFGGLGIFLIFKLMDEVNYKRESDFNILTLVKRH